MNIEQSIETSIPWEIGTPRKILDNLLKSGMLKVGNALDLCSGTGANAVYLAKKGFNVTGIDMISLILSNQDNSKNHYLQLPYKTNNFDLILDLGCFLHVSSVDRDVFLKEISRVLNKSGHYLIVMSNYKDDPIWNPLSNHNLFHFLSTLFKIKFIKHMPSIQDDGSSQYFFAILLQKRE